MGVLDKGYNGVGSGPSWWKYHCVVPMGWEWGSEGWHGVVIIEVLHHLLPFHHSLIEFLRHCSLAPFPECIGTVLGLSLLKSNSKLPQGWRGGVTEEQQHLQGAMAVARGPYPT